jgi:LysM repeat protein
VYRPSALQLNDDGTYTIRAGDTLNTIAAKLGVDVDELAELNRIANARYIFVGQILEIPE